MNCIKCGEYVSIISLKCADCEEDYNDDNE